MTHTCTDLLKEAVYGLPELNRAAIKSARIIGNPGCYPTTMQLGFYPLLKAGVIDAGNLIADCKSGVSGAGRKADIGLLFTETSDSFKAYGVSGHRHMPETIEQLQHMTSEKVGLVFTPHLVPMIRGMHSTLYARLTKDLTNEELQALFENTYRDEPFVDVMPFGSHPETRSTRASNMLRLALHRPGNGNTLVVLVVQDNLVKGSSGQAVQCMNIMFGLDETTGLKHVPVMP
jgi:N-acetyl-gamma-glutamyl-phosphate reductase